MRPFKLNPKTERERARHIRKAAVQKTAPVFSCMRSAPVESHLVSLHNWNFTHCARNGRDMMPLVRIDLQKGKDAAYRKQIGRVVYEAMVGVGVPARF